MGTKLSKIYQALCVAYDAIHCDPVHSNLSIDNQEEKEISFYDQVAETMIFLLFLIFILFALRFFLLN